MMRLLVFMMLCSGCSLAPVLEGDYKRNLNEIQNQFMDVKEKVSENSEMIYTGLTTEKEVGQVIAQKHAQKTAEWARESVEFTQPTGGSQMMNVLLGLLGLTGLGGVGAVKRIMTLTNTVKDVAGMDAKQGVEEARKRGVKV